MKETRELILKIIKIVAHNRTHCIATESLTNQDVSTAS